MRVDSSQKEDTLSFRALPPSDLFYLSLTSSLSLPSFLLSLHLILFPLPSTALRSLHLPQARKPASRSSDSLLENKSRPASWPSFRMQLLARRSLWFLSFSFSRWRIPSLCTCVALCGECLIRTHCVSDTFRILPKRLIRYIWMYLTIYAFVDAFGFFIQARTSILTYVCYFIYNIPGHL